MMASPFDRRSLLKASALLISPVDWRGAPEQEGRDSMPEAVDQGSALRVQRLGWAGVKIEAGDATLLIDPLANTNLWGLSISHLLVPIEVSTPSRHVLVTHLHQDHFDEVALGQVLAERGSVVCSERVAATVASRGYRVLSLELFEPLGFGDFTATPVPASDGFGVDQVSWVVSVAGRRVIHCGDTLWHGKWWDIGKQYGPFDAAFLPVNGFRYRGRDPDVEVANSLTPEQAAAAAKVLGARRLVPIHYGLEAPFYQEEADIETRIVAACVREGCEPILLSPGARLAL